MQARLNIYNPADSWLSRQFTLEYTALFDAILPALQHHDLPVPLGGTSNHFDRSLLEQCGGWDPFNVTEDADLGIRLARSGARVEVLASTTWEEAPATFSTWIGQRTRWLKGWMQTYVVHMREPARLWRDLGPWRFAGFQLLMGGMIASALVHPWFYLAIAVDLAAAPPAISSTPSGNPPRMVAQITTVAGNQPHTTSGSVGQPRLQPHTGLPSVGDQAPPPQLASTYVGNQPHTTSGSVGQIDSFLFWIGLINLLAGYLSAMALGALAVSKRGWRALGWQAIVMPVYWLLISLAAHRALFQLITAPHLWEKTEHRERMGSGSPPNPQNAHTPVGLTRS